MIVMLKAFFVVWVLACLAVLILIMGMFACYLVDKHRFKG
jgi:hypothetical protein